MTSKLEKRLRSERPRFTPSAGFTERVLEALPQRLSERPRKSVTSLSWFRVAGILAGAACVTIALVQILPFHTRIGPQAEAVPTALEALSEIHLPDLSGMQVQVLSAKLDEPLEKEWKNMVSDTRQAIQFIASNFLPEN